MSQSLLQGVLRPTGASQVDQIAAKLSNLNVPDDSPSSTRVSSPTPGSGSGRIPVTVSNVNSAIKSKRPSRGMESSSASSSDDDELVGVVSAPGTPRRLQSRSQSRSTSPTRHGMDPRGAASRRAPGPLHLSSTPLSASGVTSPPRAKAGVAKSKTDPVRVLTTDLTQRVFALVSPKDLASASRVCLKWNKSQSLNYIWFLQNRKLEFGDAVLPTGKWTKRESKEDWRKKYMRTARTLAESDMNSSSRYGYSTPPAHYTYSALSSPSRPASGYSTPRERQEDREERWANEATQGETKGELRDGYKELGGRKSKAKGKVGMASGAGGRDRGGWDAGEA